MNPLSVGNQAPAFSFIKSTKKKFVSLSDFRGKKVLIYFLSKGSHSRLYHTSLRIARQ